MSTANPALAQFIRSIPLFEYVSDADLNDVLRLLRPTELQVGDVLFAEGDPGRAMWILGPGSEVSVASTMGHGQPVVVASARGGQLVGEMALVDDGVRSGTATVVQGGPAYVIDALEFHAMRAAFVPAAFQVLRKICLELCVRLRQTNERIVPSGTRRVDTPPLPAGPRPDTGLIDRFPAFKPLPAVVKLALAQKLEVITLGEMTPLFAEGEHGDAAYFIVEGEVSVGRNGKTLANLPAGTMFGVVACIDQGARSASCVTTGPALLLRMRDREFDALFSTGHRFAFQLIDLLARQLVQHLREANKLLAGPGRAPGVASPASAVAPVRLAVGGAGAAARSPHELEVDDALPVEVELDLVEVVAEDEPLG